MGWGGGGGARRRGGEPPAGATRTCAQGHAGVQESEQISPTHLRALAGWSPTSSTPRTSRRETSEHPRPTRDNTVTHTTARHNVTNEFHAWQGGGRKDHCELTSQAHQEAGERDQPTRPRDANRTHGCKGRPYTPRLTTAQHYYPTMSQARVNNTHGAGNTLSPARAAGLRRERTPTQDDTRATTTPSGSGGSSRGRETHTKRSRSRRLRRIAWAARQASSEGRTRVHVHMNGRHHLDDGPWCRSQRQDESSRDPRQPRPSIPLGFLH